MSSRIPRLNMESAHKRLNTPINAWKPYFQGFPSLATAKHRATIRDQTHRHVVRLLPKISKTCYRRCYLPIRTSKRSWRL
jgi:hypothetical protein